MVVVATIVVVLMMRVVRGQNCPGAVWVVRRAEQAGRFGLGFVAGEHSVSVSSASAEQTTRKTKRTEGA